MTKHSIVKATVLFALLAIVGTAQAFVGVIAVGLGEMNDDVGRIQTSFAADATLETEEMTTKTRIHYKPGKVRDEIKMGGQEMVTIRRLDTNKMWMLMGQNMYMEINPEEGSEQAPEYKLISRELIGPETVNGMATTKYKSVYATKDGKFGGFTWFTEDNIAVKGFMISETNGNKQRVKFEFTSLERGDQDDALFEIPPGYQKFSMPSFGNMKGMGQMGAGGAGAGANTYGTPPPQPPANSGKKAPEEDDPNFAEEVAKEAEDTAKDTAKDETLREVRDGVRKGMGKLFGR